MKPNNVFRGPIIVGGGGGDGTRVVAKILLQSGVNIGNDLNDAYDNLLFTLLFRRRNLFFNEVEDTEYLNKICTLFHKITFKKNRLTIDEFSKLFRAVWHHSFNHDTIKFPYSFLWSLKRLHKMGFRKDSSGFTWGWKEPNSHIFLSELLNSFPNMKYIHLIRHGLDMAFSANQLQLRNWHSKYGISDEEINSSLHSASLKYWIRSNKTTIQFCEKYLGEKFLLIKYEDLCLRPQNVIKTILEFSELEYTDDHVNLLASSISLPPSYQRYKEMDLSCFSPSDLNDVKGLNFGVEL